MLVCFTNCTILMLICFTSCTIYMTNDCQGLPKQTKQTHFQSVSGEETTYSY